MRSCVVCMRHRRLAAQRSNTVTLYLSTIALHANGHARGALKLTPTHPCPFDRAQDRFPNHIAEHRSINQPHWNDPPGIKQVFAFQNTGERRRNYVHSNKDDYECQHIPPGPKRQRQNQKQIHRRRDSDEDDLKKPNTRQTEPTEGSVVPVKDHIAMFPETLQRSISPAETLP